MTHPRDHYKGKVVCVTGAGGSIGSEICRRLVEYHVDTLIMVGHSEMPLYDVVRNLQTENRLEPTPSIGIAVLASIADPAAMENLFQTRKVDIVINAAAHKHIPLCEQNPFDAIMNNVGGVQTLASAAARYGVKQFIQISTDKAVKPASIMGATKRACELYLNFLAPRTSMQITTVRFGNVLDSSGSVLPLWREQLRQGKPITLTDRRCERYFMSIPEAVDLTLGAGSLKPGLYVLDMGLPRSLLGMARDLIRYQMGPNKVFNTAVDAEFEIQRWIRITGLRPGEKLTEELHYGGELVTTRVPKVLAVRENPMGKLICWNDFQDLLMAARCRHKTLALEKLWELVR